MNNSSLCLTKLSISFSIFDSGYNSFRHALLRSVHYTHFFHFSEAFLNNMTLESHLVYFTSKMKFVSNRTFTLLVVASDFSRDCLLLWWETYQALGLTFNRWKATVGSMLGISSGEIAKIDVFSQRHLFSIYFSLMGSLDLIFNDQTRLSLS